MDQSQSAIIKGTHPCTVEEAAQFGALQCQITFGTHEPDKHKPGFIKCVRVPLLVSLCVPC